MSEVRSESSVIPQRLWAVIGVHGEIEFSAPWPEVCHEHINEAIADGDEEAGQWLVREYALAGAP